MSKRCIPDAVRFTGIQTRSPHYQCLLESLYEYFTSPLRSLLWCCVLLYCDGVWTGCLLPGFIKPSADCYICRSEIGAASPSQLPSCRGAAKWHKTVWCCLQSYETVRLMWKKAAAHAPAQGSAPDEWLQGLRGRHQPALTPKSHRLIVFTPPPSPSVPALLIYYTFPCGTCFSTFLPCSKCKDTTSTQVLHLWLAKVCLVFWILQIWITALLLCKIFFVLTLQERQINLNKHDWPWS